MLHHVPDRRTVCVHEAAHAVAAYSAGLVVAPMGAQVDAVREPNAAGVCYIGEAHGGRARTRPLVAAIAAGSIYQGVGYAEPVSENFVAGGLQEARGLRPGQITRENVLAAPLADLPRIFGLLLDDMPAATDAELVTAYRAIEADVLAVLRRPDVGRSIEAVADALCAGGRLVEADLYRLIEPTALAVAPEFARTIADLFEDERPLFLAFSGGKESIVLADMCEPWRDRITLIWVNTGHMAPHMVEFVRSYAAQGWRLAEVHPHGLMHNWAAVGVPANIVPIGNALGWSEPKLQPWSQCCYQNRQVPMNEFLAQQPECVLIHGQRREDRGPTAATIRAGMAQHVEVAMPLWEWSETEVVDRMLDRGLRYPHHFTEIVDSLECMICPAMISVERLAYLDAHHPEAAAYVRPLAHRILEVARQAVIDSEAALSTETNQPQPEKDAA